MPVSAKDIEFASAPLISMVTHKRSTGWRVATRLFLNDTLIFLVLEQNWVHLRHCPQQSKVTPANAENTKQVAPLNCHPISWECCLLVRLQTLLENDLDHRNRSRARGSESSRLYLSFELWEDTELCFCFRFPDPFSGALAFIIPGWAQTGRGCQGLWISSSYT